MRGERESPQPRWSWFTAVRLAGLGRGTGRAAHQGGRPAELGRRGEVRDDVGGGDFEMEEILMVDFGGGEMDGGCGGCGRS